MPGDNEVPSRFIFCVSPDHPALPGHFPGRPIVPAVRILDAVMEAAQCSTNNPLVLTAIRSAKFLAPLLPGDDASIDLVRGDAGWSFVVKCGDTLIANGSFVLEAKKSP